MQPLITHYLLWLKSLTLGQWLMTIPIFVLLLSAAASVVLRNIFHCALSLILSFVALGILFVALGAEFIGLVQILVYVGAVAVLIVFAIFLTRPDLLEPNKSPLLSVNAATGGMVAVLVLGALLGCIALSPRAQEAPKSVHVPTASVAAIGQALVGDYLLPLEATGVLLTAALVGAALLAKEDNRL